MKKTIIKLLQTQEELLIKTKELIKNMKKANKEAREAMIKLKEIFKNEL